MRSRQTGVTLIGWVVLLTPFAIVGYAGIRLAPVYLNYMKVARALDAAVGESKSGADAASIRSTIDKHFEIDMVEFPTTKDIKVTRDGGGWNVEAAYEDNAPLFSNVSMRVEFDKVVRIGAPAGE
jgi:hypothetical protein